MCYPLGGVDETIADPIQIRVVNLVRVTQQHNLRLLPYPGDDGENLIAPLVILQGPAGTAKTFLSMAAALEQTYSKNVYRKILITRPNAKMDADVGYLKGDERQKVLPTLRGLLDNMENLMQQDPRDRMAQYSFFGSSFRTFF